MPEKKKGIAAKCPAFKDGCPFKGCKTVGEFEDKLGQMRDQCKGDAAYVDFLRATVITAQDKEVDVGSSCPFFQTKGGCPFAKDTSGKPVLSPDYIVVCYLNTSIINSLTFTISVPLAYESHIKIYIHTNEQTLGIRIFTPYIKLQTIV